MTETVSALTSFLTEIDGIFTQILDWVGDVLTVVTAQPILLFACVAGFACIAIGVVKRLIRL